MKTQRLNYVSFNEMSLIYAIRFATLNVNCQPRSVVSCDAFNVVCRKIHYRVSRFNVVCRVDCRVSLSNCDIGHSIWHLPDSVLTFSDDYLRSDVYNLRY